MTNSKKKIEGRVFVLQKQRRYDTTSVKLYSNKIFYIVRDEHINPFDTYSLIELIKHRLKEGYFDPEKDFICLTGSSVLLSLFLATLVRIYGVTDVFKMLIFDACRNKYQLRLVNFGE